MTSIEKKSSILLAIMVLVGGLVLTGCGDSAATVEMSKFLQSFENKVNDLNESIKKNDSNKIVEIEKEIEAMKQVWVEKRTEHADDLTPQEMRRMVEKFNHIIVKFNEIEKDKIG